MAASATVFSQTSAISSRGSLTISTVPMVLPFVATGTSWVSMGGPIRAANQRGAGRRSSSRVGPDRSEIATPAASRTPMRTWRTERNCTGSVLSNCSAGMPCWISCTASLTISSASRIDAAISIRVAVPALKMVTAPATKAAIPLIATNTMRSCARTERPNHKALEICERHRAGDRTAMSPGARMTFSRGLASEARGREHRFTSIDDVDATRPAQPVMRGLVPRISRRRALCRMIGRRRIESRFRWRQ
jgi:hypothetical protein